MFPVFKLGFRNPSRTPDSMAERSKALASLTWNLIVFCRTFRFYHFFQKKFDFAPKSLRLDCISRFLSKKWILNITNSFLTWPIVNHINPQNGEKCKQRPWIKSKNDIFYLFNYSVLENRAFTLIPSGIFNTQECFFSLKRENYKTTCFTFLEYITEHLNFWSNLSI